MKNTRCTSPLAPQRGGVLIMSLLMLIVLTLLGVTALSMVTLEERMARGFQHGEVSYQAAATAIETSLANASPDKFVNGEAMPNPNYTAANDQVTTAFGTVAGVCNGTSTKNYDTTLGNTTLTNTVQYAYRGEKKNIPGHTLGVFVGHIFNANVQSNVASTGIGANQDRGAVVVMVASGQCDYAGIPAPPSAP